LNGSLRLPAVDCAKGGQHGGGSALTDEGRRLIQVYRRIESTAQLSCQNDIKQLMSMLSR
jgi:molybdate transport system regulatory protein